jgi:hypothetical protein
LRRLGRDGRPGDTLPNALAIQHSAKSDYRKEIVGGDFPWGPRGERGGGCANAKADRRDAGTVQLRQRAPSSSQGECEAFGRWKPLFSEAEGLSRARS